MQHVSVLGLGIMGSAMAANLLKAGFPLTVYNRTRAKAEPFAALGARIADTPADAARDADVILCMIGDDAASRLVWLGSDESGQSDGALAAAKPNAVLIESSTLSLAWTRELVALAVQHGNPFLDAPVLGSKEAAVEGSLSFLVGGDAAVLERVQPILQALGQKISHMGPNTSGTLMKLINNMTTAVHAAVLAEGLALAERGGIDIGKFIAQITSGPVSNAIVKGKAPRMVARDYEDTHFALRWLHKDMTYALRAADEFTCPLPVVAAAREVYQIGRAMGWQDADFSVVAEVLRTLSSQPQ